MNSSEILDNAGGEMGNDLIRGLREGITSKHRTAVKITAKSREPRPEEYEYIETVIDHLVHRLPLAYKITGSRVSSSGDEIGG